MIAVYFLLISILIRIVWPRLKPEVHWLCPVLALALPFSAGGFHTGTTAALSAVLMLALVERICKKRKLLFYWNLNSIAVFLLFAAYCISPLWAADRGMAAFAFPRFLPLVLFSLFLMQEQEDTHQQLLDLVPLCGCMMTAVSLASLWIPGFSDSVIVNGRLSSFLQYPNSYAAFLLAGLVLQSFSSRGKWVFPSCLLLMVGIILSGSRTVFLLMLFFVLVIPLVKRQRTLFLILVGCLILGIGTAFLVEHIGLLDNADRFTQIASDPGTFLVRLLYYRDAILAILSRPFGVGYMGYPAITGTIQTGRYYVTYIHNGLLQLMLEVGWVPSLVMAWALLRALISPKTQTDKRLFLLAILAHCMLDFDLEYAVFWILLLSCLDMRSGEQFTLPFRRVGCALAAIVTAISLWLGSGDLLYRIGKVDSCLALTPFHTKALEYRLMTTDDPARLDEIADRILQLDATHSLSYSAKANVAFSKGDMLSMIQHKENAIRCSPYSAAEYRDYFQKLYNAMQLYLNAGDQKSAAYCQKKLLEIPDLIGALAEKTHPLAYQTDKYVIPVLTENQIAILEALKQAN